jgi:NADP-dependent 3-hydroxy acid dehydrogenase YdfG
MSDLVFLITGAPSGIGAATARQAASSTRQTPELWREMVLTNVYGAALTIRAAFTALREARGDLLLTGSVAGRRAN